MYKCSNRAFTLIELLVSVAIISLLSSIVFASIAGVRDDARIAAAKQFEQTVNSAIGDCKVADYNFEGSGSTVRNTTGVSGRDGTTQGNPTRVESLDGLGRAMEFDGANGSDNVRIPAMNFTDEITVSFWQKGKEVRNGNFFFQSAGDIFRINLPQGNGINWKVVGNRQVNGSLVGYDDFYERWNHWLMTYSNITGVQETYLNGSRLLSSENNSGRLESVGSFTLAARGDNYYNYGGLIDNVRIYDCAFEGA